MDFDVRVATKRCSRLCCCKLAVVSSVPVVASVSGSAGRPRLTWKSARLEGKVLRVLRTGFLRDELEAVVVTDFFSSAATVVAVVGFVCFDVFEEALDLVLETSEAAVLRFVAFDRVERGGMLIINYLRWVKLPWFSTTFTSRPILRGVKNAAT
jgi:hypothetical protein